MKKNDGPFEVQVELLSGDRFLVLFTKTVRNPSLLGPGGITPQERALNYAEYIMKNGYEHRMEYVHMLYPAHRVKEVLVYEKGEGTSA